MVSQKAFDRVSSYLTQGNILYGGETDPEKLCIEPTILECPDPNMPVMQEEIFGPVFPMVSFTEESFIQQAIDFIVQREKPLALYFFGDEKSGWEVIGKTSSGGGCINDVIMHIANGNMPFGGVGNSGMGRYHHRESFECFTHTRSILVSPPSTDIPLRYMPYNFFRWIKRII
jgi:aldehyde dehydrogenase (NAD+)